LRGKQQRRLSVGAQDDAQPLAQPERSPAALSNVRSWPIADIGERPLSTQSGHTVN